MRNENIRPTPERTFQIRVLGAIRPIIEEALLDAGVSPDDINWIEQRHDVLDLTASWPRESPSHNIHASLTGNWPRFPIEVEGHTWEDSQEKQERRNIRVYPFPIQRVEPPGVLSVSGSFADPTVTIANKDELSDGMKRLAKEVASSTLPMAYPLEPDQRR